MSCPPARTGRHRQRYEDEFRLVAGCIPYKFEKGVQQNSYNCDPDKSLRVLMISTPNRHDLVFPKGGWEDDESVTEAACREALEEAGVKGVLRDESLGVWEFRSKSSEKKSSTTGGGCRGHMYAMEVTHELESWPEQTIYVRKWLTVDEAFKVCRYDWMRDALMRLLTLLSKDEREKEGNVENQKTLMLKKSDHRNLFSPVSFGKSSGVLSLDNSYKNCPFSITNYFLAFTAFLFKYGNLFTTFRSSSYLERKAGQKIISNES